MTIELTTEEILSDLRAHVNDGRITRLRIIQEMIQHLEYDHISTADYNREREEIQKSLNSIAEGL